MRKKSSTAAFTRTNDYRHPSTCLYTLESELKQHPLPCYEGIAWLPWKVIEDKAIGKKRRVLSSKSQSPCLIVDTFVRAASLPETS